MSLNQTAMHKIQVNISPPRHAGRINFFSKIMGVLFLVITATIFLIIGIPGVQDDTMLVTFSLEASNAQSVAVVGDFNRWNASQNLLKKVNGIWETAIRLKKGNIYTYNFLLDGNDMITDPKSQTIDDGYGGESSIIEIK